MTSKIVLEARGVSVQYPGTLALNNVTFALRGGTVTALIGENGAGKSTLVKVLAGIAQPTRGSLFLDGKEAVFQSVRDADARGIGIIHQELNLCPNLSVAENIFLGREISRWGTLNKREQERQAAALLQRLDHPIDPRTPVSALPLGHQQIVEIAKALARDVRVLMMDEPTSALSAPEIEVLFRVIRDLKSRGVAIVYISHRLEELLGISDSVSVLRDGRMVAEAEAASVDVRWIVEQMTGRVAGAFDPPETHEPGETRMSVNAISLPGEGGRLLVRNVSLEVRAGEVLGIYGLMGAGRTELLECIMGLRPEMTGSILLDSKHVDSMNTGRRIDAGLAMVPEDRQVAGLVQSLSVLANMTMASLDQWRRGVWLSAVEELNAGTRMAADLRIKTPSLRANIGALSGGNQQKVVMAKCLLTQPRVLLLDEPTRGVDVGAKREIHAIVRRMAASGMAVILVSSELDEIRAVADRILVMSRGSISAEFSSAQASGDALALAASAPVSQKADQI